MNRVIYSCVTLITVFQKEGLQVFRGSGNNVCNYQMEKERVYELEQSLGWRSRGTVERGTDANTSLYRSADGQSN